VLGGIILFLMKFDVRIAAKGKLDGLWSKPFKSSRQKAMVRSILDLADVTVKEIMVHRKNVTMIDLDDAMDSIVNDIMKCPYSRIPLYRTNPDNIVGVLHTKWLMRELKAVGERIGSLNLEAIAADPWFIPGTTTLYDQLQAFRNRGEHFAFIVDEYGAFDGIVTLEDILEEIVGDISDEHDQRMPGVRKQINGTYLVNGEVTIRDLRREFDWDLPDEDYSTVAGLLLRESRCLPDIGHSYKFYRHKFDILRRHRNQITLVRVTPPQLPQASQQ
jgi:Mg2+/Co2+ transporter CorB